MTTRRAIVSSLAGLLLASDGRSQSSPWASLRAPDHFALVRHALAPGTFDPPDFRLDDCTTQRTLSDEGRAQAVRIGGLFRANGVGDPSGRDHGVERGLSRQRRERGHAPQAGRLAWVAGRLPTA